jgi:hypothetical protein
VARTLDRDRQGALILRVRARLAAGLDLGAIRDHPAQALDILVVGDNLVGGELIDLATLEEAATAATATEAPSTTTAPIVATWPVASGATGAARPVTEAPAAARSIPKSARTGRAITETPTALRAIALIVNHRSPRIQDCGLRTED